MADRRGVPAAWWKSGSACVLGCYRLVQELILQELAFAHLPSDWYKLKLKLIPIMSIQACYQACQSLHVLANRLSGKQTLAKVDMHLTCTMSSVCDHYGFLPKGGRKPSRSLSLDMMCQSHFRYTLCTYNETWPW